MKRFFPFLLLGILFFLNPGSPLLPQTCKASPLLEEITFEKTASGQERVSFKLNGAHIPKTFAYDDGLQPKVVFDFYNVEPTDDVKAIIPANGRFIKRIRMGRHEDAPSKTRVVFDMQPNQKVEFNQQFNGKTNTLVITLSQGKVAAAKKTLAPVATAPKVEKKPTPEKVEIPGKSIAAQEAAWQKEIKDKEKRQKEQQQKKAALTSQTAKSTSQPQQKSKPSPAPEVTSKPAKAGQDKSEPKSDTKESQVVNTNTNVQQNPTHPATSTTASSTSSTSSSLSGGKVYTPTEIKPAIKPPTLTDDPGNIKPQPGKVPRLFSIEFDNTSERGEMVLFQLNEFYPPVVFGIEEGSPRVICDFMETEMGEKVPTRIDARGQYVQTIRTSVHQNPQKIRTVIDLRPNKSYDLQQVFFKDENLFILIINTLKEKKQGSN